MRSRSLSAPAAGVREPDVGGDVELGRLDRLEFLAAADRRAGILHAADELLLLAERRAIPLLDPDPDLAGDEIGAAGHPLETRRGCGPDVPGHPVALAGIEIGGAVLEAHQVARCAAASVGGGEKALLEPPERCAATPVTGEVPDRMERHLRVVGARLDADVAARLGSVELVLLEQGEVGQLGRPLGGEAVPAVEQPGPEAEGDRQPGRIEPTGFAGVVGWRELTTGVREGCHRA